MEGGQGVSARPRTVIVARRSELGAIFERAYGVHVLRVAFERSYTGAGRDIPNAQHTVLRPRGKLRTAVIEQAHAVDIATLGIAPVTEQHARGIL